MAHARAPDDPDDRSPAAGGERGPREGDLDLAPLSPEERDGVALLLETERVAHEVDGDRLRVAPPDLSRARELVDIARSAPSDLGPGESDPLVADPGTTAAAAASRARAQPFERLAPPAARLAAGLAEAAIGVALARALRSRLGYRRAAVVAAGGAGLAAHVAGVALAGASPGLILAGARVQVPPRTGRPGWGPAARRGLILHGPLLVALAAWPVPADRHRVGRAALVGAALAAAAAVRASVLLDPWGRGVHDRAAATVVVRHRPGPGS
jgi:uncharacterized RDD family membrane protein YckC